MIYNYIYIVKDDYMNFNDIIKRITLIKIDYLNIKEDYLSKSIYFMEKYPETMAGELGKAVERILKNVLYKEDLIKNKDSDLTINQLIEKANKNHILNKKIRNDIDIVKRYRNDTVHDNKPLDDQSKHYKVDKDDVENSFGAFFKIYDWYLDNYASDENNSEDNDSNKILKKTYSSKIVAILVSILVIIIVFFIIWTNFFSGAIEIGDRAFADCIKQETGNSLIIRESELSKITELNCEFREINEINGIEYLTNLESVNLSNNNIEEISFINLISDNINHINLSHNKINHISPILEMVKEDNRCTDCNINIEYNKIYFRKGSQNHEQMLVILNQDEFVDIDYSRGNIPDGVILIPDSILEKSLKEQFNINNDYLTIENALNKNNNEFYHEGSENSLIKNLTGLDKFINLHTLILNGNEIRDISPLKKLTNLKIIYLNSNYIEDISPLNGIQSIIEVLILRNNRIKDFGIIKTLYKNNLINNKSYIDISLNQFLDNDFELFINDLNNNKNFNIIYKPQIK